MVGMPTVTTSILQEQDSWDDVYKGSKYQRWWRVKNLGSERVALIISDMCHSWHILLNGKNVPEIRLWS